MDLGITKLQLSLIDSFLIPIQMLIPILSGNNLKKVFTLKEILKIQFKTRISNSKYY